MTPAENPHAGQGSVLLDIGGDVGALVVTMPKATIGTEVEIRPVTVTGRRTPARHTDAHDHAHDHAGGHDHDPGHLLHVAVVPRPVAGATVPSLVFPELVAGTYDVFVKGQPATVVLNVAVEGGRVTSADWPQALTREQHPA